MTETEGPHVTCKHNLQYAKPFNSCTGQYTVQACD